MVFLRFSHGFPMVFHGTWPPLSQVRPGGATARDVALLVPVEAAVLDQRTRGGTRPPPKPETRNGGLGLDVRYSLGLDDFPTGITIYIYNIHIYIYIYITYTHTHILIAMDDDSTEYDF